MLKNLALWSVKRHCLSSRPLVTVSILSLLKRTGKVQRNEISSETGPIVLKDLGFSFQSVPRFGYFKGYNEDKSEMLIHYTYMQINVRVAHLFVFIIASRKRYLPI